MVKYVCEVCGYVYDPAVGDPENGIPAGTAWEQVKEDWICPVCGNIWRDSLSHRSSGRGCNRCSQHRRISFNEKAIFIGLTKTFPELEIIENYRPKWLMRYELDIFIPSLNLGIEYDGRHYHQELERDLKKDSLCSKNKVQLIRIKEYWKEYFGPTPTFWIYRPESEDELTAIIKQIEKRIAKKCNITKYKSRCDVKKNRSEIYLKVANYRLEKNLLTESPEIADELHPTFNGKITATMITPKSSNKYWWLCKKCGHAWEAKVENRVTHKTGCPKCSRKKKKKNEEV